jgi:Lrp/AsnC family transcriptional regulator for asnA, asnC and gidA
MKELQIDGGAGYSELAAKLGITPKTAASRVERLIQSKILAIRAQPNPYKLGFSASALIFVKTDPGKIDEVCERLAGYFNVNLVQTIFGRFDVIAIVFFPNWEMLHGFISDEVYMIDGVTHVELFFIKEIFKRYERFFQKEPFGGGWKKLKDTDWVLIEELAKNARLNAGELAEKLGVHTATVYRRISALLKGNIIKISGVPNPSRLEYSASAFITLDAEPAKVDKICKRLYSYHEIHFILTLNNRSGVIVCVHTKDNEALYEFIKRKVAPLKGIINTETFIRAMVQKTYYGWLMDED